MMIYRFNGEFNGGPYRQRSRAAAFFAAGKNRPRFLLYP